MEKVCVQKKFMSPVKIILAESFSEDGNTQKKYSFSAVVLVWDPAMNYEWSIISRNNVRYNREYSLNVFKKCIAHNNGVPFLYNHIMTDTDVEQLGLVTAVEDTGKELIIKGYLNGNKKRVTEEILPGFLNNVSLQVDGERHEVAEGNTCVIYARPTELYEVSAVPVQGIPGANLFDIALAEAVKAQTNKEELTTTSTAGAIATKISKTKKDKDKELDDEYATGQLEEAKKLTKEEIEKELIGIKEDFNYDKIFEEAMEETKCQQE